MRLSEFIEANHEVIINEWSAFARTMLPWAEGMSEKGLRDHAEELLTAVVGDMVAPQSEHQKSEKSKGNADDGKLAKIGEKHAEDRLNTGLDLNQLVSEFRALRASVLRLWEESNGDKQNQVTRFNEAIDETLATSTDRYLKSVANTREHFLGILGHDLRNPIGSIIMGGTLLRETGSADAKEVASVIVRSGERMNRMVGDLLDLTRGHLGKGIPIECKSMDLVSVCKQVLSELKAAHPGAELHLKTEGNLVGQWDSDRLFQVISNLVSNALQYGDTVHPVSLNAYDEGDHIFLAVHNKGGLISESAKKTIFEPMTRHHAEGKNFDKNKSGLGLGLYIASQIVVAHGGIIDVVSSEESGTTFSVRLPRLSTTR